MRGLTIYQPWATYIAEGRKEHETRYSPSYRGPLLIHAGKAATSTAPSAGGRGPVANLADVHDTNLVCPTLETRSVPAGSLISPSRREQLGDWSRGRYAWKLTDVKRLKVPVPWRGLVGLWPVPPELIALIKVAGLED